MRYVLLCVILLLCVSCSPCDDYITQLAVSDNVIKAKDVEIGQLNAQSDNLTRQLETITELYETEKNKPVYVPPRDFNSLDELKVFLKEDKTNEHAYNFGTFDCEQFSQTLIQNAEEKGLRLYLYPVNSIHMKCYALIDNGFTVEIYAVEPRDDQILYDGYFMKLRR